MKNLVILQLEKQDGTAMGLRSCEFYVNESESTVMLINPLTGKNAVAPFTECVRVAWHFCGKARRDSKVIELTLPLEYVKEVSFMG